MKYDGQSYVVNNIPDVTSDYWDKPVIELQDQLNYYNYASMDLRNNIWPECIKAYLCRRDLPELESMEFLDQSPLGETDIWDGINFLTDAIMNSLMPRDQSYLELLSYESDDQGLLNDIRDFLMSIHRSAGTRDAYAKHMKQCLILGTSALWWRWERLEKLVKLGTAEAVNELRKDPNMATAPLDEVVKLAKRARFPKLIRNGPLVRPIDMFDFWIDPATDMSHQGEASIITRFYLTKEELQNSKDEFGQPKYKNLDGLEPQTLDQLYFDQPNRLQIITELGVNPLASSHATSKFVPVYVFHAPVRRFDADPKNALVDCFIYMARSTTRESYRIIRVEDNPHANGSRGIYVDSYIDLVQGGYGVGAVEKSVNAWQYKNVLSALGLQSQVMAVAPAYTVIGGSFPDENKIRLGPGGVTIVKPGGAGHDAIRAIQIPIDRVQAGQMSEKWQGQKILGQLQAYGAMNQEPTKQIEEPKTATQIHVETSSGSVVRDNFLEKVTLRSLEQLMQDVYDACREYLQDDIIQFEQMKEDSTDLGQITREELDKDRKVLVTGYHGILNKAKEMQDAQEALQILTTGNALETMPQLRPVVQELIFKILGRLGIKNLEKYKQDPVQMIVSDPQVQAQLVSNPQSQQLIMHLAQMIAQGVPPNGPGIPGGPAAAPNVPPPHGPQSFGAAPSPEAQDIGAVGPMDGT